jgi:RND family efflux transporter MFP subunit
MSKKNTRIVGFLVILFILVLIMTTFILPKFKSSKIETIEESDEEKTKQVKATPVIVEAGPAFRSELIVRVSASGSTEAIRFLTICPKIGGEISGLPIREGQFVYKGDLLIKLDDTEHQLNLADARNNLLTAQGEYEIKKIDRKTLDQLVDSTAVEKYILAKTEWEKTQALYKNEKIDEATYNSKRLNFQSAQILTGVRHEEVVASKTGFSAAFNAFERAKLNLSRLTITSPFSGIIGDLNVQSGQYVSPSTECCKIIDLSRVRINVGVLESEIQHLKSGRTASIELPAYQGENFQGKIVTINPILNPENKTFRVCVELDNPNYKIKAGMFAYVKLDAQIYQDKLLVPRTAILTRDQRTLIFVIRKNEDGTNLAKWNYVDTGLENEEYVEILKSNLGLDAGEQVITSGHYTLAHDAEVRVVSGE